MNKGAKLEGEYTITSIMKSSDEIRADSAVLAEKVDEEAESAATETNEGESKAEGEGATSPAPEGSEEIEMKALSMEKLAEESGGNTAIESKEDATKSEAEGTSTSNGSDEAKAEPAAVMKENVKVGGETTANESNDVKTESEAGGKDTTALAPGSSNEKMKDEPAVVTDEKVEDAVAEAKGFEITSKSEPNSEKTTEIEHNAGEMKKEEFSPRRSGRDGRERKSVDVYAPEEKEKKERVVPNGKGQKLEDMPNVVKNFQKVTWSDPHLKMLYSIVFGVGKKKEFKSHLLQFNGLVYPEGKDEEDEREKVKMKMYKLPMDDLKSVMDLCDVDRSPESFGKKIPHKEMLCNRFLEWLEEPKPSGKKLKSPRAKAATKSSPNKRKSPASAKGSSEKSPAKKAKKETSKPQKTPKSPSSESKHSSSKIKSIDFNIPGASIEQVREKVKSIVNNANRQELTVKGVRKILEDWLDTDLSDHKDAIRSLVMEAM